MEHNVMESEEVMISDDSEMNVIDLIDLTKESPDALQSYQRHDKNIPAYRNRLRRSNFSMQRPSFWDSDHEDMLAIANYIRTREARLQETIELDDNSSNEEDDNKNYTIQSDTRESIPLTCPICLDSLCSKQKPVTTRCGHIFCKMCLKASIRSNKKCPTCKSNVTLKSCIRLYF